MRRPVPLLLALLSFLAASVALAQESPDPQGVHPVLVTVDDLPIAVNRLHDAAERERITRDILAVFKKHGIKAVGMVVGRNMDPADGKKLLDMWLDAGQELGNHTYGHLNYTETAIDAYVADAAHGLEVLRAQLAPRGLAPRWFRFPFLCEGNTPEKLDAMRAWLAANAQRNVPVTIDGQDWSFEEPWVTARRANDTARLARLSEDYLRTLQVELLAQTVQGDELFGGRPVPQVLLLHANEVGAAHWDAFFTWMKTRGFRFATSDEVLADAAFAEPHRFVGNYGGGVWSRIEQERRTAKARADVLAALAKQAADWNRGDLAAFCSVYADDATFASPSGVTTGREGALERYRKRYPDRAAMGTLTLEPVDVRTPWGNEVTLLGDAMPGRVTTVTVLAKWSIARTGAAPSAGHTLLVFRRLEGQWKIVQDASF